MRPLYAALAGVALYLCGTASAQTLEIPLAIEHPQGLRLKSADPLGIPPLQVGMAFEASGGFTTWFNVNSTVARHGGGSFMEFLTPNLAGKMISGATINAGLIDATPGHEGGDFELMMPCKGVFSRGGYNCGVAMDGTVQAFYPTFANDTSLGYPGFSWGDAWITRLAMPVVKCPSEGECVAVLAGGVPGYIRIER